MGVGEEYCLSEANPMKTLFAHVKRWYLNSNLHSSWTQKQAWNCRWITSRQINTHVFRQFMEFSQYFGIEKHFVPAVFSVHFISFFLWVYYDPNRPYYVGCIIAAVPDMCLLDSPIIWIYHILDFYVNACKLLWSKLMTREEAHRRHSVWKYPHWTIVLSLAQDSWMCYPLYRLLTSMCLGLHTGCSGSNVVTTWKKYCQCGNKL